MATLKTKVAIIGAGSAGMRAYREVTKTTDGVLLIEDGPYGTTGARVGCMPSKLLIAAAEVAHAGSHRSPVGVTYDAPKIDGAAVMNGARSERDRITGRSVGAEMIGPRAEHLAHLLAWSLQSRLTVSEMLERLFCHPLIEEGLRTALRILNANMQMGAMPPPGCIDCGPDT